jgi:hypothetical protein
MVCFLNLSSGNVSKFEKTAIIHYFYVVVIILTAQNQNVSYSTEGGALLLRLGTKNISTDT